MTPQSRLAEIHEASKALEAERQAILDRLAQEACPFWPGQPMTAHWGVPDPAAVKGASEEIDRAFRDAFVVLDRRIGLFLSLPLSSLQQLSIQRKIENIGRS